ncbi:hypothetical protein J2Z37_001397 [Ammoniphilus resinae]|uniref:FeoB-associated Cys-rich membrane protein n=1 Tax=Ammoniphilus resinae TaxID=861532 RepID=A0ABS4GM98_9BACL|nr:hypothetical protein [Ammoniphilus resinae]
MGNELIFFIISFVIIVHTVILYRLLKDYPGECSFCKDLPKSS